MFGGVFVELGFVGDRTLLLGGYSLGYGLCIDRVFRWWFVELLCLLVCWCMFTPSYRYVDGIVFSFNVCVCLVCMSPY